MPTDVLRGVSAAPVVGRTQAYHKHFTRPLAARQNVVNIPVRAHTVEQPANDTPQISDLGVPFLFSFRQG